MTEIRVNKNDPGIEKPLKDSEEVSLANEGGNSLLVEAYFLIGVPILALAGMYLIFADLISAGGSSGAIFSVFMLLLLPGSLWLLYYTLSLLSKVLHKEEQSVGLGRHSEAPV